MLTTPEQRASARLAVVDGLADLRTAFPLEARLSTASMADRQAYARILNFWITGPTPVASVIESGSLETLRQLDAIVPGPEGLGCYPFSAHSTGIRVELEQRHVSAMCAIDALAVARLSGKRTSIHATCAICTTTLQIRVEDDGSLDHDQADCAHVIWRNACHSNGSCSDNLCRNLLFACPSCPSDATARRYTLPQAATIANAYFAFQRELLRSEAEAT